MKPNYKIIISDTSCLILLSKIDELDLLNQLFDEIFITSEIQKEFGKKLPDWIKIKNPRDIRYQELLEMEIDKGEASAIALSFDIDESMLILDDYKARQVADKLNIKYTGTFGIILRAKKIGLIDSVKPILKKIKATNFRFSEELFEIVLREAKEI